MRTKTEAVFSTLAVGIYWLFSDYTYVNKDGATQGSSTFIHIEPNRIKHGNCDKDSDLNSEQWTVEHGHYLFGWEIIDVISVQWCENTTEITFIYCEWELKSYESTLMNWFFERNRYCICDEIILKNELWKVVKIVWNC